MLQSELDLAAAVEVKEVKTVNPVNDCNVYINIYLYISIPIPN